jgi:hypothetical protein
MAAQYPTELATRRKAAEWNGRFTAALPRLHQARGERTRAKAARRRSRICGRIAIRLGAIPGITA